MVLGRMKRSEDDMQLVRVSDTWFRQQVRHVLSIQLQKMNCWTLTRRDMKPSKFGEKEGILNPEQRHHTGSNFEAKVEIDVKSCCHGKRDGDWDECVLSEHFE